jgi:hypothetical protein
VSSVNLGIGEVVLFLWWFMKWLLSMYRGADKSLARPGGKRLTGHLQPRRNWPTWAPNVLITQHIPRIRPRRITTCFLDWKCVEKFQCKLNVGLSAFHRGADKSLARTGRKRLTGHLQTRRNWPTWASNVLITHLFPGSDHVGLPPVPWTEKNNLNGSRSG